MKKKLVKTSTIVLLEDLCGRMERMDKRLDAIEQEIEGVKKAVKTVMFLAKLLGGIASGLVALWKCISFFMPKGKGNRKDEVLKDLRKHYGNSINKFNVRKK